MITTINNKHKKLNVPNLRFPEFQGEWKKTTIGEIATIKNGPFGSVLHAEDYVDEGMPIVTTEHFKSGNLPLSKNGIPQVSEDDYCRLKGYMLETDDIVFSRVGSVDINAHVEHVQQGWLFSGRVLRVRPIKSVNSLCLHYVLSTESVKRDIRNRAVGQTMPSINTPILSNTGIYMSQSEAEQKKIANLLSIIDERIATQNKIIDKLQSLIKGMEDNLLDNPLWEKTYLRSFMQFFPTNSLSWEQLSYKEGAIRNLHYGLIHGLQTRGINSASLPMIKNEAIPKQYTLCQVGDVAFADASEDTGEIAKSVEYVDTIEGDTICGLHTIHGRDIKNRTVVGFKGFAFNSRYFHNQIKRLAQGTKVFSITANNLSSCYVYLPDLETQKAIVNLLKTYEAKLLVTKRLLEHYEKQKQYLLRQMFI